MRALLLATLLLVPTLAGCAAPGEAPREEPGEREGAAVVFGDVHGLAVHPQRPEELYVATHNGLYRAVRDASWTRMGDSDDDLMGFTMSAQDGDTVWSSGHPKDRSAGSNLGVRVSRDAGRTWTPLGLPGVDCHAMISSPADSGRLWCMERGRLHASEDGGATWTRDGLALPPSTLSLAAHPARADTLYAATAAGIHESGDGGASWRHLARESPVHALALSSVEPRRMVLVDRAGAALSRDAGATWERLSYDPVGGTPAHVALSQADDGAVYVATYEGAISKSEDGGATWRLVRAAPGG